MRLRVWLAKRQQKRAARKLVGALEHAAKAAGALGISAADWERYFTDKVKGGERWGKFSTKDQSEAYSQHDVIYSCMRKILTASHEAPMVAGREVDGQWTADNDASIMDVLYKPNSDMSYADLMEYHFAHLLSTGKSFVWKWRDATGAIRELWPVPTHWVKIKTVESLTPNSEKRLVDHYTISPTGGLRDWQVESKDMVYTRFIDPTNFVDGVGPLQAAFRAYKLDQERSNYLVEMLENLRVPGLFLTQKGRWAPETMDTLREALKEKIGKGKRGSPLLLHGENIKAEMLAPLKDLDWPSLSNLNESRICAVFGVPPIILGLRVGLESGSLSGPNFEAAEKVFYRGTMQALWLHNGYAFTRGLLQNEGVDELELRHDTSSVRALRFDLKESSDIAKAMMMTGGFRVDELREVMGYAKDPLRGRNILMPMSVVEIPMDAEPESEGHSPGEWDTEEEKHALLVGHGGRVLGAR